LNESNVRTRILCRCRRASEREAPRGWLRPDPRRADAAPLRRTFASILYALGRTPPQVMEQLGHTDPKLALRIYARAMRRDPGDIERLRRLAGVDERRQRHHDRNGACHQEGGEPVIRSRMRLPGA
jgi:hypothetical protein